MNDRIDASSLCDTVLPLPPMNERELAESLLPSSSDLSALLSNFVIIASRVVSDNIKIFQNTKRHVVRHIPHLHSREMASKSEVVRTSVTIFQIN